MPPKRRETEAQKEQRDKRAQEKQELMMKEATQLNPMQIEIYRSNRRISQSGRLM